MNYKSLMGWNSWNTFGSHINEKLIMEITDNQGLISIHQDADCRPRVFPAAVSIFRLVRNFCLRKCRNSKTWGVRCFFSVTVHR